MQLYIIVNCNYDPTNKEALSSVGLAFISIKRKSYRDSPKPKKTSVYLSYLKKPDNRIKL